MEYATLYPTQTLTTLPMNDLRIISLPVDKGGCGNYRIRQPFSMIARNTPHQAHVIDQEGDDMIAIAEALSVADIIVIRQGGEVGLDILRNEVGKYGKEIGQKKEITAKTVLDIDDNIEIISPYSQHYEEYGTEEYYDEESKVWLWKNGENNFDVQKNRKRVASLLRAMTEVDMVTATTKQLAEYASQYNPNVAVLPNLIDREKWWRLPLKHAKPLRIGWSGGVSHYEDWYSIKEPLNQLLRKYRFKLVMVGAHFEGVIDEDLRDLVEVHPWVPFEAHSFHMMALNLDLAIIPLADLPFNYFKSPIKFYEFSSMGVPSLVANVSPYKEVTKHLTNSLTYEGTKDFYHHLDLLIRDADLRRAIGSATYKESITKYDAAKQAHLWTDAYASLLTE
jgi:glycosyltransferase involved in cell wall biosynthesis